MQGGRARLLRSWGGGGTPGPWGAPAPLSLVWTPADPLAMSIGGRLRGPSAAHPFGTDQYGRDILSRVMVGAVTSIAVGIIAVGLGVVVGLLIGMLSGYVGG